MIDRYSRLCLMVVVLIAGLSAVSCRTQEPVAPAEVRVVPEDAIDPADPTLTTKELQALNLQLAWRMSVTIGEAQHDVRKLYIDQSYCFVETVDAYLFAYNAHDGVQQWMVPLSGPMFTPPAAARERVYVVVRNEMYYVRKDGGGVEREVRPRMSVASMAAHGQDLILGAADNRLVYFDTQEALHRWNVGITGSVLHQPLILGDTVVAVGWRAGAYGIDIKSGRQLWSFMPSADVFTRGMTTDGSLVYVAGTDAMLYAVRPESGNLAWQHPIGAAANSTPVYVDGQLFVFAYRQGMLCFDPAKPGPPKWRQPRVKQFAAAGKDRVYAVLDNGNLAALRRETGEIEWERPLPSDAIVARNPFTKVVIISTKSGFMIGLTELL